MSDASSGRPCSISHARARAVALEIVVHALQPFDLRRSDQPFGRQDGFATRSSARAPPAHRRARPPRRAAERRVRAHRFEHLVQRTRRHGGLGAQQQASVDQAGDRAQRACARGRRTITPGQDRRGGFDRNRPGSTPRRRNIAARPGPGVGNSRLPSRSWSAGVLEDRAGRRSRAGRPAPVGEAVPLRVSTFIQGAASSRASGNPSSRRQITVTVGPFADVRRKPGCTSRTRSTNSRTAAARANRRAHGIRAHLQRERPDDILPFPAHVERGTAGDQQLEPTTTDVRRSATSGAASRTCSKLSSTSRVQRSAHATRARFGRSRAVTFESPSASPIAEATNVGAGSRRAGRTLPGSRPRPDRMCDFERQTGLPDAAWPGERDQTYEDPRATAAASARRHRGREGREGQRQRDAAEFIDGRDVARGAALPMKRVASRTRQVERGR